MKNRSLFSFVIIASLLATACSSPHSEALERTRSMACSFGNGDAYRDFESKKIDLDYYPKEEFKMFSFEGYTVPENEKEAFKQLFKMAARGCYLSAIQQLKKNNTASEENQIDFLMRRFLFVLTNEEQPTPNEDFMNETNKYE